MSERSETEQDEYTRLVHDALSHLYDAAYLQSHPLLPLLGFESGAGRPSESQRARKAILDGIEALKPARGAPASSPLWRSYTLLQKRFIDGLSPGEVMAQMGLGKSQFFIEQKKAVETLAACLRDHAAESGGAVGSGGAARSGGAQSPAPGAEKSDLASEAGRLARDGGEEQCDLIEALRGVESLVRPLFERSGIALETAAGECVTLRGPERVLLRQSILVLLTFAAEQGLCRRLVAVPYRHESRCGIRFELHQPNPARQQVLLRLAGLESCRQLVSSAGGTLRVEAGATNVAGATIVAGATNVAGTEEPWALWMEWTAAKEPLLLVVDDNAEYAALFRRYLAGYPWEVAGANSVTQAQQAIRASLPAVVTIDILMPGQDGWELLTALKSDPVTRELPVFICSVLNEQQLARILGVAEYLPKPVSRDDLLRALARVQVRA